MCEKGADTVRLSVRPAVATSFDHWIARRVFVLPTEQAWLNCLSVLYARCLANTLYALRDLRESIALGRQQLSQHQTSRSSLWLEVLEDKCMRKLMIASAMFLSACAGLPPSASTVAVLPVVTYPDQPPAGPFVYKLPGGQPLRANASIQGTLLAKGDEKTLEVTLPHDLFVYKRWVSEDRQNWVYWSQMMDIRIGIAMPSDEHPKDGEMRLVLNRK